MNRNFAILILAVSALAATAAGAQTAAPVAQVVKGPDERFKTDILVVVAHPDDEGGVTPYLARAIYDEHKRVAVVFATRGGSGGNDFSREHGPALADIREQEARAACAKLGITHVWFLSGKDTASQNVLNSLANWGHGANLEELVRIVRLTRPEVIITWLPGIFIGENHGDHQAAGVLATEAFDMAGDATVFPAQVGGATKRLEVYLENLTPWQPKKLYFFSDADDQKQFSGTGPAYSVKEISPSQKKPYWRLALDAATPHLTQFPGEIHQLTAMSDEQLSKFMDDPQHMWWTEPMTLTLGKTVYGGATTKTEQVFSDEPSIAPVHRDPKVKVPNAANLPPGKMLLGIETSGGPLDGRVEIGGIWSFYKAFLPEHDVANLSPAVPEIAVKAGAVVSVPVRILPNYPGTREVQISTELPAGWKTIAGEGLFSVSAATELRVDIQTPELSKESVRDQKPVPVIVRTSLQGRAFGEVRINILLKASGLPQ